VTQDNRKGYRCCSRGRRCCGASASWRGWHCCGWTGRHIHVHMHICIPRAGVSSCCEARQKTGEVTAAAVVGGAAGAQSPWAGEAEAGQACEAEQFNTGLGSRLQRGRRLLQVQTHCCRRTHNSAARPAVYKAHLRLGKVAKLNLKKRLWAQLGKVVVLLAAPRQVNQQLSLQLGSCCGCS
jgi:hypothetical protein